MRNVMVLLMAGVLIMSGCATVDSAKIVGDGRIDVIAHRGASAIAPENTLAAFRLAHELKADWFELDCTLTKDEEIICIHDDSVDRTTNGKGKVKDLTLSELKKLDAGSWKSADYAGERLPTLGETFDMAKGNIGVYIEIKNSSSDGELEKSILTTFLIG